MYFSTLLSGAALFHLSMAGYVLEDDYMKDFFGSFDFFTAPDPSQGFVQYVDRSTAQHMGLINSSYTGSVSMSVDSTNVAPKGRSSVRISSKKSYNSGLVVLDVEHMPTGCGTWPAFWMVGPNWPRNGEIDILEGINDQEVNAMTLHTGPGCSISTAEGAFTGEAETDNCDIHAPGQLQNAGCSIKHPSKQSYGAGLNEIRGGVYATLWTEKAISVYFFPRGNVPEDVLGDSPDPSTWGTPAAKFAGACDIGSVFTDQQIVIDTTFCGAWAGNAWGSGSCASKAATCEEYVRDNPKAFAETYWTINALKVYQDNGDAAQPSKPVQPAPSTAPIQLPSRVPVGKPSPTFGVPDRTPLFSSGKPSDTTRSNAQPPSALPTNATRPSLSGTAPSATGVPDLPTAIPPPPVGVSSAATPATLPRTPVTRTSAPSPLPTGGAGGGPMRGFQWPIAQQDGNSRDAPVQSTSFNQSTAVLLNPVANATAALPSTGLTTPAATVALPSAPAQEASSSSKTCTKHTTEELAIPIPTGRDDATRTARETVFITVFPPERTFTPGLRLARHVRQHRRRLTQHHAK